MAATHLSKLVKQIHSQVTHRILAECLPVAANAETINRIGSLYTRSVQPLQSELFGKKQVSATGSLNTRSVQPLVPAVGQKQVSAIGSLNTHSVQPIPSKLLGKKESVPLAH